MFTMNIKKFFLAAVFAGMLPTVALSAPLDDCEELGGTIDEEGFCVVIDIEDEPFARMVRSAGASGLGWTVVGMATTTTVTMYELELVPGSTTQVLVPGDPTLPGCRNANNAPLKCTDHYVTVTNPDTYGWIEIFKESNTAYVNLSCLNPANRDMGQHMQCGF